MMIEQDQIEAVDEGSEEDPLDVAVILEEGAESVESMAARETTPERFPTPKKMWRERLSQSTAESEDLPDTHLPGPPEESRYSPSRQASLEQSQEDEDGSQPSLLSQLPESQTSQEGDEYSALSQVNTKKKITFAKQENNICKTRK